MEVEEKVKNRNFDSKLGIIYTDLQHRLQVSRNLERGFRLAADLVNGHALGVLDKGEAVGRADLEDGEVGDDRGYAARAGQRERALGQDLGVALLVGVFLRLLVRALL